MKKILLFFAFLFAASISIYAQTGYEKSIEINGGVGLDGIQNFTFGISMINGYRLNNALFLGVGVGYEYLDGLYYHHYEYKGRDKNSTSQDSNDIRNNIQLFGRVKANLTQSKVSPFLSCDLGYTLGLSSNEIKMANGLMFEPAFGCDFAISEKQSVYVMLGYNGQNYEYKWINTTLGDSGSELEKALAGKFCVHVGFKF